MGQLQSFQDATGKMTPIDINAQNIQQIIDEFNRSQDLLDALNNNLKIINRGTIEFTWDGTVPNFQTLTEAVGSTVPYIFLLYYSRSDIPDSLFFIPSRPVDLSGNAIFEIDAGTVGNTLEVFFNSFQVGSPIDFTAFYFIIQQPANVTNN